MAALQVMILLLVAAGATALVATRDPLRLPVLASLYALVLTVLFLVFQAPDVALSELIVGAIGFPLVIVVALRKERKR
jgi:energy-converting hydrogenase B subunit D